jgi:predicted Zn-dependent protease with MMP-like domain
MPLRYETPPSLGDLEEIAQRILTELPDDLMARCRDLVICIEEFPDAAVMAEMGIESPFDLAGLYQGVPLTRQEISRPSPDVDMIFLYRRPLLDWWCEEQMDLDALIRHVLVHEIGHHFGFSDADVERIEATDADNTANH